MTALRVQQFSNATFHRYGNAYLENENQAAFGQVDYTPAGHDSLTLSLGARWTTEKKNMQRFLQSRFSGTGSFALVDPGPNLTPPELDFSNTSLMFSAAYRVSDHLNLYAKYAEGFRSGGYDGQASSAAAAIVPFASEELTTIEGMQSRWLADRLQLNLAASTVSTMTWSRSFTGTAATVLNAGASNLHGPSWRRRRCSPTGLRQPGVCTDRVRPVRHGRDDRHVADRAEINNALRNTVNLALDYDFPSLGFGELALHLNYNYWAAAHAIAIKSNGRTQFETQRGLLDARLTLSGIELGSGAKLQFALWG